MKTIRSILNPAYYVIALGLLLVGNTLLRGAEELKGATAVLQSVAAQSGKKAEAPIATEGGKLRVDLENFSKRASALGPADAAKQWLGLVDRFFELPAPSRVNPETGENLMAEQLVAALPAPASWGDLAKLVHARPQPGRGSELRESGLRLLVAALAGDKAMRDREIQALQSRAEKASRSEMYVLRSLFDQLNDSVIETADDPDAVLKALERRIARASGGRGSRQLRLPNLVALLGEERAEAFLRQALTTNSITLVVENSNATAALARKLALTLVNELKTAQWGLVNSLDSIDLFEALDRRFSNPKPPIAQGATRDALDLAPDLESGDSLRSQAETYYFLGLIGKGRAKDAVAVAQRLARSGQPNLPHEALESMERAGYTKALDDFFFELLTQDSSLPFWTEYVQLAAKAGRTERMLKLARATAVDEKITKRKRTSIHQNLFRALLADGQVEEGVAEIKRLLETDSLAPATTDMGRGQLGLMLAKLGVLLTNTEWMDQGIRAARNSLTNAQEQQSSWMDQGVPVALASLLFELNRSGEAEAMLTDALAKAVRASETQNDRAYGGEDNSPVILSALASLYFRANRPADVVVLLDTAPYWGVKDVSDLESSLGIDASYLLMRMQVRAPVASFPVPFVAASALTALNRKAEARILNNAVLVTSPGFDRAYQLALELDGENAAAHLDEIFARDRFEERPLIWKARLLAERKDYVAAEEVIRRAIAIDPSDGEQGPGDRMRAYAVLADVREARGDEKDASFFRGVVKAIRLSEEADQYYAVGLLKRAVSMYQDSLKSFADAYCIQSRLAIQLAELGLHDQAEEHYRRAYELMPDSFGRVESHCFGCERAFTGLRAQSLAEKIFTELVAKQPKKPQVHYLLGYLREEQGRHAEAVPHFKTAVALDPEYLNAWQKLLQSSAHVRMPAPERDQIVFNLLRLDPLQRHTAVNWQQVSNLRELWTAIDQAHQQQPEKPKSLYPLAASKALLEKNEASSGRRADRERFFSMFSRGGALTPGAAIAQTTFVQTANWLLNYQDYEER